MKTAKILLERLFSKDKTGGALLEKTKVRNAIESMCQVYLVDFDDTLTFEALPEALDSTLAVIEEPSLTSKYDFTQISETLFQVRLKDLNMFR